MRLPIRKLILCLLAALVLVPALTPQALAGEPSAYYGDEPETNSAVDLLYEVTSGQILYEKDIYEKAYPASTTKIMTALLALENCDLDEIVTVTSDAWRGIDRNSSIAGLSTGEYLPMRDMLVCLLVASGNEAANAIAIHIAGSISAFVEMMNARAEELGCQNTHFANPHGLHNENHYTCAYDLLLITLAAREFSAFREIVAQPRTTIAPTNKYDKERRFNNTNLLLSNTNTSEYLYSKATGVKTGYTTPAGYCLVSSAKNDELEFVAVVLGGEILRRDNGSTVNGCYRDTLRMYRWGYEKFKVVRVISVGEIMTEAYVDQAQDVDHVLLESTAEVNAVLHRKQNKDEIFSVVTSVQPDLVAPIEKGQVLGSLILYKQGQFFFSCDLVAASPVVRSEILSRYSRVREFLRSNNVRFALTGLAIIIVGYVLFVLVYNSWRKKHPRRYRRR